MLSIDLSSLIFEAYLEMLNEPCRDRIQNRQQSSAFHQTKVGRGVKIRFRWRVSDWSSWTTDRAGKSSPAILAPNVSFYVAKLSLDAP